MKKKISSVFKIIILLLLFLFTTVYISNRNGYYAYNNYQKNILTEDGIKQFEEDVSNGIAIDINNYIAKEIDYSNNISKTSLMLSNKIGHLIKKGLVSFFEKITSNID